MMLLRLHPRYLNPRVSLPPVDKMSAHDYVMVHHLDIRATYPIRELMSVESVASLARIANTMEGK